MKEKVQEGAALSLQYKAEKVEVKRTVEVMVARFTIDEKKVETAVLDYINRHIPDGERPSIKSIKVEPAVDYRCEEFLGFDIEITKHSTGDVE